MDIAVHVTYISFNQSQCKFAIDEWMSEADRCLKLTRDHSREWKHESAPSNSSLSENAVVSRANTYKTCLRIERRAWTKGCECFSDFGESFLSNVSNSGESGILEQWETNMCFN